MRVLREQNELAWLTGSIHLNPKIHEYAKKLVAKFPDPLKVIDTVKALSKHLD